MSKRGTSLERHGAPGAAPPTRHELRSWVKALHLSRLPSFETVEQFLADVSEQRRRPLRLVVSSDLPGSICGVWLAREAADLILIDAHLRGPRRELVILHEVAHVLLGHSGATALPTAGTPCAIKRDHRQEWQAEWLATYLLSLTRGLHRGSWLELPSARYAAAQLGGWR